MKKVLSLVCVLLLCAALIPAAVAEEAAYTETVVSSLPWMASTGPV